MGSWTETCAITNQSLVGEAYCVILPKIEYFNGRLNRKPSIAKGVLNYYGELTSITEQTEDNVYSVSTYWDSKQTLAVIFVSVKAWEAVVEKMKKDGIDFWAPNDFEEQFLHTKRMWGDVHKFHYEWFLIEHFLANIRRSFINNNQFSGSQSECFAELEFANSLIVKPENDDL